MPNGDADTPCTPDPFSCFGGYDSESSSSDDENIISNSKRSEHNDAHAKRLKVAANALQANSSIDHMPVTSPGFEVYSCSDMTGYNSGQLGVRALRPYRAGEEILRERPVMRLCTSHAAASREEAEAKFDAAVHKAFDALSTKSADAVMDLSSCNEQTDGMEKTPTGIFNTNSYRLGSGSDDTDQAGLFLTAVRINHSCRPNASHHWRPDLHMMLYRAASDIGIGDEICTCYGPGDCRTTEKRQMYLKDRYSFDCACEMCQEGNETGGDDRMVAIASFHDNIQLHMTSNPEQAVKSVDNCLRLLTEHGIGNKHGPYVQPILHYGYQICLVGLQDEARARSYLARELLSTQSSQGCDSYTSIDLQLLLDEMKVDDDS